MIFDVDNISRNDVKFVGTLDNILFNEFLVVKILNEPFGFLVKRSIYLKFYVLWVLVSGGFMLEVVQ